MGFKMKKWFILLILVAVTMVGCTSSDNVIPPPAVEGYNPGLQNPQFAGFTVEMECTTISDINYTNLICPQNMTKTAVEYNTTNSTWSSICCSFDMDKCHWEAVGDVDNLCVNVTSSKPYYVLNQDGNTRARCCNSQGKDCYMDYNIDPTNASTICNKQYTLFEMSMNYSAPVWWGLCCQGGYE